MEEVIKKSRFRVACIIFSIIGALAGLFMPILIIDATLFEYVSRTQFFGYRLFLEVFVYGEFSASNIVMLFADGNLGKFLDIAFGSTDASGLARRILLVLVPAWFGIVTAIFSMMKSRPVKTTFSLAAVISMFLFIPLLKKSVVDLAADTGSAFGDWGRNFLANLASGKFDESVYVGSGYYIFMACFVIVTILNFLSIKQIRPSAYFSGRFAAPQTAVMIKCLQCGGLNPQNAEFCNQCGTKFPNSAPIPSASVGKSSHASVPPPADVSSADTLHTPVTISPDTNAVPHGTSPRHSINVTRTISLIKTVLNSVAKSTSRVLSAIRVDSPKLAIMVIGYLVLQLIISSCSPAGKLHKWVEVVLQCFLFHQCFSLYLKVNAEKSNV